MKDDTQSVISITTFVMSTADVNRAEIIYNRFSKQKYRLKILFMFVKMSKTVNKQNLIVVAVALIANCLDLIKH